MTEDSIEPREPEAVPPLLTYPEVAEVLRVDVRTVYAMVQRGQLPGMRLGTRRGSPVRIDRRDLARFIDEARGARAAP